jgi:hypothetical protein
LKSQIVSYQGHVSALGSQPVCRRLGVKPHTGSDSERRDAPCFRLLEDGDARNTQHACKLIGSQDAAGLASASVTSAGEALSSPDRNALYALAFLRADAVAMAEQQRWFAGKPEYENFGLALESDSEAYGGHVAKARELTKRAVDSAIRPDSKENGAIWQANAALQQAAYANSAEARQTAAEALKLVPTSQGVESEAALAFAMAGDACRQQQERFRA